MNIPNEINTVELQQILDQRKVNKLALLNKVLDDFELDKSEENCEQAEQTIKRNQRLGYVDQNYTVAYKLDYEIEENQVKAEQWFKRRLDDLLKGLIYDSSQCLQESCACVIVNRQVYQLQMNFICEALLDFYMMTGSVPPTLVELAQQDMLSITQQERIMEFLSASTEFLKFCIARKDME